jgi:hypothetical protein
MSQNPTPIVITTDLASEFLPCIEYIFGLFGRLHGYSCSFLSQGESATPGAIFISYLFKGARPAPGTHLLLQHGGFFGTGYLSEPIIPEGMTALAECVPGQAFRGIANREDELWVIPHDVIAASYLLITGYLDHVIPVRDQFGRLLSSAIPLPSTVWDLPVVNHWFRQLHQLLLEIQGRPVEAKRAMSQEQQTIVLTHDVDRLQKHRAGDVPRSFGRNLLRSPQKAIPEAKQALRCLRRKQRDPYDSFDALYTVKERISAPSSFFYIAAPPGKTNGDYTLRDPAIRQMLSRAAAFGDEIGIHGSWESGQFPEKLKGEVAAFQNATGRLPAAARQHYLRYKNPETYWNLQQSRIPIDSSAGFADKSGFRLGWSGCLPLFDPVSKQPMPLIEIPLICMDVTLAAYEKIPAELCLERLTNLLDASCDHVPGGAFVFLWHNIMADRDTFPGYWDVFEYFFSVASGSARFATLTQVREEFEKSVR